MKTMLKVAGLALALNAGAALAGSMVSPAKVLEQLKQPATAPLLLDVRTPEEFASGHVPGARNIPIQVLGQRLSEVPRDRAVIVYCESGRRSARAIDLLKEGGYTRVTEMEGSMAAWRDAGYPVEPAPTDRGAR